MNGLILVGGRSTRMGADKSQLSYHAKPQWKYLFELVSDFAPTYLSCRKEQQHLFGDTPLLLDSFEVGPMGGIASAFFAQPESSWLVVACDMPFVNQTTLEYLVAHREAHLPATVFRHPSTGFLEPLVGIWEPTSEKWLREAMTEGAFSPTKLLRKMDIQGLACPDERWLQNINTPDDCEKVKTAFHIYQKSNQNGR
ncbi:MAG: NTP transferase domain-containing protein [Bacteroidetes bacterium]|nr:NTP transferase domain-containing protein [Bacteroidota bacterium]